jgi:hypothetical protein
MRGFWHFVQYHNAIPIAFSILFIGSGTVLAASPEVRDVASRAVFDAETSVVSVDNTYIADKDLSQYTPSVQIMDVTEDDEHYYVQYQFTTIDVVDHVWQDVVKDDVMKVSKADLGPHRDLGVYVTEQLKQKVGRELAYLKEVQQFERAQVSNKVVATAYSGLVGAFLDDKTEKLPGYTPRVVAPGFRQPVPTASAAGKTSAGTSQQSDSRASGSSGGGAPVLQILGKNPAYLTLGASYADLGAVVSDNKDTNLGIKKFLNDKEVTTTIQIDTATTSEWRVRYEATDTDGNTSTATRRVIVYDPANPPVFEESTPPTTPEPSEETPVMPAEEPEPSEPEPAEEPDPAEDTSQQDVPVTTTPPVTPATTTPESTEHTDDTATSTESSGDEEELPEENATITPVVDPTPATSTATTTGQ